MTEPLPRACVCEEFREALAEGMLEVIEFEKGPAHRLLYILPHSSGDIDEAWLMVFCPFCAGTVGDGWKVAADTNTDN